MTQETLNLGDIERQRALDRQLLRALRAAVEDVGGKVFADRVGVHESAVSRALKGEADRPWRQEWTTALLLRSPEVAQERKAAVLALICAPAGMQPVARQPESARDVAQAAIAELRAMGPRLASVADELEARLAAALAREVRR